jgi:hypothetical protein
MTDRNPLSPGLFEELQALTDASLRGAPRPEQMARLEQLLRDPASMDAYLDLVWEADTLATWAKLTEQEQLAAARHEAFLRRASRARVLGFLYIALRNAGLVVVRHPVTAAIVLLVALAPLGLWMTAGSGEQTARIGEQGAVSEIAANLPSPTGRGGEGLPVAHLGRTVDCVWSDAPRLPAVVGRMGERGHDVRMVGVTAGDTLEAGRRLVLQSGLAEIVFQDGARAILQGPASLEVRSRSAAFLDRGKCTVSVENAAVKGFEVDTRGMKYTDLGTEFGVLVAQSGEQEVHVFRGRVQAATNADGGSKREGEGENLQSPRFRVAPSPPLVLSANESIRVEKPQENAPPVIVRQAAKPDQFVRAIPEPFPLYSTGVGLDRGSADPHWEITAISSDRTFTPRPAVVIVPPASYIPDARDKAQWLAEAKVPATMPNACRWTLRTRFDLTGFEPATARIEGRISADNYVVAIRLNGKQVPLPRVPRIQWFEQRTPIQIKSGFTAGINTVELVIENAVSANPYNPMAICLEWTGTAARMARQEDAGQ